MATSYYESFIKKLKEIFMMDHAELDFGIYRIMNQKRSDIQDFLEKDLLPQVKQLLAENNSAASALNEELKQAIQACHSVGINPDESPKVMEIKKRMAASADVTALENEVYSHLTTFFSRYYEEGDFISKRRYKDNTYAIPYNGEEVKLYWANADQYYIKTSEYFKNYTFRLADRRAVHFVLKEASTEQNNNKAQNNQERRFTLYEEKGEQTIEVIDGEMNIYFTYELMPKTTKQKDLNSSAVVKLKAIIPSEWEALMQPVSKTDSRLLIEKHLTDYTAKNSFDYFIHKDLGNFLRRELDFYIKNEVMHLDDLDTAHIQAQLSTVKAIKGVGDKIIRMLASIEDFQKKLWLKKKFVVQTDYCITLDRVPESLYAEICANEEQRKEWVRLYAIDEIEGNITTEGYSEPLTEKFLKENPFLVLDTQFFSAEFKHKLLASIDNMDEQCNGLLINSENFQALELLSIKYEHRINSFYWDPPYNAPSSLICYKNNYKDSSWISLLDNRLIKSKKLRSTTGCYSIAIDKWEHNYLYDLCRQNFTDSDVVNVAVEHNKKGTMGDHFSYSNEYAIFIISNNVKHLNEKIRDEKDWEFSNLRNWGGESLREDAANCFYPIYINNGKVIGFGAVPADDYHPTANETVSGFIEIFKSASQKPLMLNADELDIIAVYPIDSDRVERKWRYAFQTIEQLIPYLQVTNNNGLCQILMPKRTDKYKTMWYDTKYNAGDNGTSVLTNMGLGKAFSYPKSIYLVKDCVAAISNDGDIVMDIFAGSGTTAHAVINMNSKFGGNRKYILCEMGNYFRTATKPRIEKVIYSEDWRDGKPVSRKGVSQCFKYIRLEQYEDTLNNLVLKKESNLFNSAGNLGFKESYMLGYMMDTESRGSLFNLEWFVNPFAMTLKTTKDNELVETPVDMVETFNFLIGLNIETEHWHNDGNICVVEGVTHRKNEKALVIWRNCEVVDNQALNRFFEKMDYSTLARDFDIIYVNGDNTLPNLRRDEDRWKVVLIEEEFKNRMFEED